MNTFQRLLLPLLLMMMGLPVTAHAVKVSYTYDVAGRLTAVNYNGASRTTFSYDKNGDLLARTSTVTPVGAPPAYFAATYTGLVTHTPSSLTNTGVISLKLLPAGSYSGKINIAGVSYPFSGTFAANGATADFVIVRPGMNNLTLHLALDVTGGSQRISGTLSDTVFTSDVALDPSLYNATTNPPPLGMTGKFTALFIRNSDPAPVPQANGYATVVITAAGVATIAGKLPTNVAITYSTPIVGVNVLPIYLSLNSNAGYLAGNATIFHQPVLYDFAGALSWIKPTTTGALYPDPFNTKVSIYGSRYTPPAAGQRALDLANTTGNAAFGAYDGGLPANIGRSITLDTANKFITPVDAVALKLSLTATTGAFTGSFKDGSTTRAFGGVLFQIYNNAEGFFPATSTSGVITLTPNY